MERTLGESQQEARALEASYSKDRAQLELILHSRTWRYTAGVRKLLHGLPSPQSRRLVRMRRVVANSGIFDKEWYVRQYPDVAGSGIDPLTHFLHFGAAELRDPSPRFSSRKYLSRHSDVAAAGVNPLVHYLQFGIAEGREIFPVDGAGGQHFPPAITYTDASSAAPDDVFGYISAPVDASTLPKRIAIGISSLGNFFMAEVAYVVEDAFRNLGVQTRLFTEEQAATVAGYETLLVVAPHEFFLLGKGPEALEILRRVPRLVMFNVEQRQTQWFRVAQQYLPHASAILDISYHTARFLARAGHRSFFLPLGYSDYIARTFDGRKVPEHEIFRCMPPSVRDSLPEAYADRPIDILFIGASSERRQKFFARHASYFANKETVIYLPETTRPFLTTEIRSIDFASFVALARRSKILLNVHQDDDTFFEWQRIVTLGIMQRTLVVTDHCEPVPCIEPAVDFLDAPLPLLPDLCETALRNISEVEALVDRAYAKLQKELPMEQVLAKCWTALAASAR
jgi:hypothetical protein